VLDGVTDPLWQGEIWRRTPQPKHAIANCCCPLANGKKRFRLLANYFGAKVVFFIMVNFVEPITWLRIANSASLFSIRLHCPMQQTE